MVHDTTVILIRGYILRIIINETHGCIWHAAPRSELKEELEHHTEHCQMFNHHIMVIGVFIAWVWHPSILFTFILRRCNAFIISVIAVVRRSIIFKEHFLWHFIAVGQIYIHAQLVSSMWCCPNGHISYMSHDWLTWVLFIIAWHCGREARTNFFTCCDIFSVLFCILDKSVCR